MMQCRVSGEAHLKPCGLSQPAKLFKRFPNGVGVFLLVSLTCNSHQESSFQAWYNSFAIYVASAAIGATAAATITGAATSICTIPPEHVGKFTDAVLLCITV